jgi:hypothetical protein
MRQGKPCVFESLSVPKGIVFWVSLGQFPNIAMEWMENANKVSNPKKFVKASIIVYPYIVDLSYWLICSQIEIYSSRIPSS